MQPNRAGWALTAKPLSVSRMSVATINEAKAVHGEGSLLRMRDVILTSVVALVVLAFGWKQPAYNWDIIGYVAAALHADGYRGADLNKATYDSLRGKVSADTFDQLIQGDYRQTVYRDPASLAQQLPFYRIRVLYVGLLRAVHRTGVGYPKATYRVSAVFAALSVVWLALLANEIGAPIIAVPLVVAFSGFADAASLSTPDAMACFFSLLTIYLLIRGSAFAFVIAALLPLVRTDFLLLSLLVSGHAFITGQRKYALGSMVVACVLYEWIVKAKHAYGWLALFNTSLIHKTAYPATLVPSHVFGDYLKPYTLLLSDFVMRPHFAVFCVAMVFLIKGGGRALLANMRVFGPVFIIPMAFTIAHLLLFPSITYRYFVFAVSVVAIGLIAQMKPSAPSARLSIDKYPGTDSTQQRQR